VLVPEHAHAQRLELRGGATALPAAELQRIVARRAGAFLDLSTLQVSPVEPLPSLETLAVQPLSRSAI